MFISQNITGLCALMWTPCKLHLKFPVCGNPDGKHSQCRYSEGGFMLANLATPSGAVGACNFHCYTWSPFWAGGAEAATAMLSALKIHAQSFLGYVHTSCSATRLPCRQTQKWEPQSNLCGTGIQATTICKLLFCELQHCLKSIEQAWVSHSPACYAKARKHLLWATLFCCLLKCQTRDELIQLPGIKVVWGELS